MRRCPIFAMAVSTFFISTGGTRMIAFTTTSSAATANRRDGAVVLFFHDTNVRENDFGVVVYGKSCLARSHISNSCTVTDSASLEWARILSDPLRRLFSLAADPEAVQHVRNGYARCWVGHQPAIQG